MNKNVLGIFAHPDDAEIICAGTLSLLRNLGWSVHIATMAKGDKGTYSHSREEISRVRKAEATNAAEVIGATYHCLEFEDLYVFYNRETINRTTALLRKIRPSVVFTASPDDYMIDHETTSKIVQTACFSTGIKNLEINEELYEPMPYLYYCDPLEGKDKMGEPVTPSIFINIASEILTKEKMLSCHKSQEHWLLTHQFSEYVESMKRFAQQRGKEAGFKYAEGFRQHHGHGYPQNNILKEVLGDFVIVK